MGDTTLPLADHIASINLNRPDKANDMNLAMWREILQAFKWVDATPEARAAILAGEVRLFTSGEDRSERVGIKEIDIGMTADVGTLQRLPKLIGEGMARELAYTVRKFDATEALQMKLVNRVFGSPEALRAGVREIAASICSKSPLSIRGVKEIITYARDHTVADGLNHVATWNAAVLLSSDRQEAMMGNMGKPEFKD
ncbi:MAG: enoyl-CoA hydratase-related protein [Rhodoferax sp.]|uniref:enoyl-CoA hydratase-related protein n=1 Tax=Rhodoferax sp. TaxID=50421 RepID=UPI00262037AC|nr:enoyl-CoA hydratase-related protein [Rhodoferax sp.]MDD2880310.1 enoyl-CoA hydratase-related protein [Rhodoferax sp.]